MSDSMLSFIDALGGGTSLWSSTLMAPGVILFKHWFIVCQPYIRKEMLGEMTWLMIRTDSLISWTRHMYLS